MAVGFFIAPYSADKYRSREEVDRTSVRDALFFSKSLPYALRALGHTKDVYPELQDWQTTAAALFALEAQLPNGNEAPVVESAATFSTLHNTYDKWLQKELLAEVTTRIDNFASCGDDLPPHLVPDAIRVSLAVSFLTYL